MGLSVEKCLQAWTNSLKQMSCKADIVFFGDSLTYYGNFSPLFPNKVVCNLGLRGDTILGLIDRVEQIQLLHPEKVYIMAGINDVSAIPTMEFGQLYARLLEVILHENPKATLVVQSILPVNSNDYTISCNNDQVEQCNAMISEIAYQKKIRYLDLYPLYVHNGQLPPALTTDGLHLKKNAYGIWYESLKRN